MERIGDPTRQLLRHTLATLAYRAAKAVRDAPEGFATFRVAEGSRAAGEILAHMGDLLDWALALAQGRHEWHDSAPLSWPREADRFFAALAALDAHLMATPSLGCAPEKLFQGPLADGLAHAGQIAMLRRLAGAPIKGENYFLADIVIGRVGTQQTAARREFD